MRIWEIFDVDSCHPRPHDNAKMPRELRRFIRRYNKERTIINADVHILDMLGTDPKDRIARGKRLPTVCYYGKM